MSVLLHTVYVQLHYISNVYGLLQLWYRQ